LLPVVVTSALLHAMNCQLLLTFTVLKPRLGTCVTVIF